MAVDQDVRHVLQSGDTIAEYHDGRPIPSRLVLGWVRHRPIHVVAADDPHARLPLS
jgi:hypothetical protein